MKCFIIDNRHAATIAMHLIEQGIDFSVETWDDTPPVTLPVAGVSVSGPKNPPKQTEIKPANGEVSKFLLELLDENGGMPLAEIQDKIREKGWSHRATGGALTWLTRRNQVKKENDLYASVKQTN